MKKLLTILFVLFSVVCFSQSIVPRATAGNTVSDARLQAQYNFFIPRYADTTAANVQKGIDSTGAIIFTYDVNNFWVRVGNPKHWQQGSGGGTVLPDGVYSGGQVAYSGSGYDYIVSAATYVLAGVIYNSPQDTITLDAADPTYDRIDVIGLTDAGTAGKVTGTPAANPQEPSVNPQVFIRRSVVTVVANTTQPPNIDQSIIYDEGTGEPDEWTPSSEGNTDFLDTQDPYHLTIDAITVAINPNQRIKFVNDDTINSGSRSSLVIFTKLLQPLVAGQNINVQLLYQGNPVSNLLPLNKYGLVLNVTGYYQMSPVPFTEFSNSNIIFDEVDLIPTGASPFPFFFNDYIQIQSGLSPIVQIPDQRFGVSTGDNFANENRLFNFNQNRFEFNNIGKEIHVVSNVSDSAFVVRRGIVDMLRLDATQNLTYVYNFIAGNPADPTMSVAADDVRLRNGHNLNLGSGSYISGFQQAVKLGRSYPYLNGSTATEFLTIDTLNAQNVDSALIKLSSWKFTSTATNILNEKAFIDARGAIWNKYTPHAATSVDSILIKENGYIAYRTKAELGITGTVTSVATNAATGITGGTITTSGTLAIDTTLIATRAWVGAAGAPGTVSSFIFTDGNGFDGTVNTATTTPTLSLTTNLTQNRIPFIGVSGALSQDAGFTVDPTNKRIQSYITLPAGTATANTAPLKFTTGGVLLTTPEGQAMETTDTHIYWTNTAGSRIQLDNPAASGVTSITGTANQVIASSATGAVTLSLPQSIGTTSSPTFTSLTLGGTAATTPLTFTTNTDATASAGRWYYNTTRLGFSLASTILRVPLTNDVAPTAGQGIFGNGATYTVGTYSALNNSVLVAPSASGVTFRTNSIVQTLSGTSVTMNINNGENAQWTLTASGSSLAITNPIAGRTYFVNVIQDGTGSRTITTYPSGTVWYSGTAPVLKTTPAANNLLAFYYNGSNYYGYDWGSGGASGFSNPMTTLGDMIYGGASGVATRVAGNITASPNVLVQTGTGAVSAAPSWQATFTGRTNSATLDFPNTGAQSSSELTITVTGAVVGDVVTVGTTVNNANSTFTARVSATNIVSVKFNNYGAAAINPASGTFKVIVWQ